MQGVIGYLQALRNGIKSYSNAVCIFQTFAAPAETLFGSLDRRASRNTKEPHRQHQPRVGRVYSGIRRCAAGCGSDSRKRWGWPTGTTRSCGTWQSSSFSDELIPLYADHVARIVAALRGKSRKVLILDLDNTVWGGVIGDDGLEGIKIAQGDATR